MTRRCRSRRSVHQPLPAAHRADRHSGHIEGGWPVSWRTNCCRGDIRCYHRGGLFKTCCLKEEHESPSSSFISPTYIQHLHIAIIPQQLSAPACVHRAGPCGQPLMAASSTGDPPPRTHSLQYMLAIEMRKHAREIGQGRRWGISNVGAQRRPVVPPAPREGPIICKIRRIVGVIPTSRSRSFRDGWG